ncbi:putative bacterioferritin comigratory protein [Xylogone sp. PMI_703]|nr:putative bacterioferritin comigratory protein [Xylogone sp. PMI_703]
MSLIGPQLSSLLENFISTAPDAVTGPIIAAKKEILSQFDPSKSIKVGDKLPEFKLQGSVGKEHSSTELLKQGPLGITFYRGEWCPFCNIAVAGLQKHLDDYKAKGVTLVAITPELPNGTLTMAEKHDLKFPVLTDLHNEYARKLGIVWKQPDSLRPVFDGFGHDLSKSNGDDSFEVPFPATLLVDKDGTVRNLFLDPDYTKRVEPKTVLEWINAL